MLLISLFKNTLHEDHSDDPRAQAPTNRLLGFQSFGPWLAAKLQLRNWNQIQTRWVPEQKQVGLFACHR
jgi:hypothetical protein